MKKTTANLLVIGALGAAGILPMIACGGSSKPAAAAPEPTATSALGGNTSTAATPTAEASAGPLPAAPVAPADTSPAPIAQVLETDTHLIQKIYEASKTAPSMKMGAGAGDLAKGVHDVSQKLPAGMKADGPMATGSVREKQHLQMDVSMQPGKCYSIVGYSKKVKDLDLYLFMPPGILSGQDLSDDNKPVVGGPPQPMCPVGSSVLTYKLDVFADKGGGEVAVQVYSKGN